MMFFDGGILMNVVTMVGRLTKDVELRVTQAGTPVANFSLAVNRDYVREGEPKADFFTVVLWGKLAESCNNHIGKGAMVAVRGTLQNRSYTGKDGNKRYVTEIIGDKVQFLLAGRGDNIATAEQAASIPDEEIPF